MDAGFKLYSFTFTYLLSRAQLCRLVYVADEFFYFPSAPPTTQRFKLSQTQVSKHRR